MHANSALTQGNIRPTDLRLAALAFIADAPRHGYEIIRLIEETTAEWYVPSPNLVYPTLGGIEQEGYVTASADPPKLYTITETGRAYLDENREGVDALLGRLTGLGERVRRWRHALGTDQRKPEVDDSAESLVEILARAANEQYRNK